MYENKVRNKSNYNVDEKHKRYNINEAISHHFSGKYPSTSLNHSMQYFENLQRELDARHTKKARLLFRKKMLENQNMTNYTNELNRIVGEISKNDTRLPIGTIANLNRRKEMLEKLGAKIADKII